MENNTIPRRKDIPEKYTWDLTPLYADTAAWETDLAKLDKLLAEFSACRGTLADSPEALRNALEKQDALSLQLDRLYCYAHLRADEDTQNSDNQKLLEKIRSVYASVAGETAWFEPEAAAIDRQLWQKYCNSPELAPYVFTLQEMARAREHLLSDSEERLLGLFSESLGASSHIYSLLSNADMRFAAIRDSEGAKREVSHGSFVTFLESKDRKVRRKAFKSMFSAHKNLENTFAATLSAQANYHAVNAKVRNFPSALAASLFDDNIPESVYHGLISEVNRNLPALHRYLEVRRRMMGLKKLDIYDLYVPLGGQFNTKFTYEEAMELIIEALSPMGRDYTELLQKAFTERWIDLMESTGKRSGAYSSGCYGSNPYILTNFHGTLDDVFTLAHELGHSLHSWYSRQCQPYHYSEYSIFAAEIASITNEMLLFRYLEKKYAPQDKSFAVYLACHLAEQFRTTLYRQTMFAEFELTVHSMAEKGIPVVAENLNRSYYELKSRYTGHPVKNSQLAEVEWARIPHFYYNFYVYKYATGLAAAVQASELILSGSKTAVDRYKTFLAAGGSRPVLDILRDAGIELADGSCVAASLKVFAENMSKLEALAQD